MRIIKNSWKILKIVALQKNTLKGISKQIKLSQTWCSEILTSLEKKGFIKKQRKANQLTYTIAETSYAVKFKELIYEANIDYENILETDKLRILSSCLYDWKTTKIIAEMLNTTENYTRKLIYSLKQRGLFIKKGRLLKFNKDNWKNLYEFLDALRMHSNIQGNIIWKFEDKILYETNKGENLTAFSAYNIPFHTIKDQCFLPKKKLSKAEIFIHSLKFVYDTRTLLIAIVFYKKNKLKNLEKLAIFYDCIDKYEDFKRISKNPSKETSKQEWDKIKRMYGV